MKITMTLLMFCVLAFAPSAFAQTIDLFNPTPITESDSRFPTGGPYNFNDAISFGETQIFCPVGGTGTISGATGGNFIADNFLTVNGTNVCPGGPQGNCFSAANGPFVEGAPVESGFTGVAPIPVNSLLAAGGLFTFRLMDYGGFFGNSDINLTNTNCTSVSEDGTVAVCHRNNRNKNGKRVKEGDRKTIFVDAEDADDHLAHGDTLGPCTES